jgi:aminoglycoside 6'-N-acetyltransferase
MEQPMTTPASVFAGELRLLPATDADWPMIRGWLAAPEIIRWWGPKASTEAEVMLAMSTPQAICRIVVAAQPQGQALPIGYAHAVDAGLIGTPHLSALPAGTWHIDLFVSSPEHRGRGFGARILEQMCEELFTSTLALNASVLVAVGNEKAVRAYERAGFRWQAVVRDKSRGAEWLMIAPRDGRGRSGTGAAASGPGSSHDPPRLL